MTDRFNVNKTIECKRCGATNCYWVRSYRTGKPYMVSVASDGTTSRRDFHNCATVAQPVAAQSDDTWRPGKTGTYYGPQTIKRADDELAQTAQETGAKLYGPQTDFSPAAALVPDGDFPVPQDPADKLIADNRDTINEALNLLFRMPDAVFIPACDNCGREDVAEGDILCGRCKPKPAPQIRATTQAKTLSVKPAQPVVTNNGKAVYACTNSACRSLGVEFQAQRPTQGKPTMCAGCNRVARFQRLA